jgi:hypothetical protein
MRTGRSSPVIAEGIMGRAHPRCTARQQRLRLRPGVRGSATASVPPRTDERREERAQPSRQALRALLRGTSAAMRPRIGKCRGPAIMTPCRRSRCTSISRGAWQVPVLRFQLARRARRAARGAPTSPRCSPTRRRARGRRGARRALARDHERVPRRRHAEPVLARGDRRACSKAHAASAFAADVEVTMEANPGTIERGRFAAIALPASTASRSARRASMPRRCSGSAASMRPTTRAAPPRNCTPPASQTSTST